MKWAALFLLTLSLAPAQTPAGRGRKVIDEVVSALGGEKFLEMKDRVEYGRAYSFYRDRLSGLSRARISTRYMVPEKPGALAVEERQAFGKDLDSGVIFALGKGWNYSFRGARPIKDEIYQRYEDSTTRNIFYILRQRLDEPGMIFDFKGTEVLENAPVEIVDITDSENRTVTVYIHASTKLPLRQVFYRRDLKTRERDEEVTIFSKYRDVGGGVQWPFAIQRSRNGDKLLEMYSESVTINQSLVDTLFRVEGQMKLLPPEK
jgi:hypothetical protein